jgi:hypothetical protein
MFEVYAYLDPSVVVVLSAIDVTFTLQPFYIGKGNIKNKRKLVHLKKQTNKLMTSKLNKIYAKGVHPQIISIKQFDNEEDALQYEILLIKAIGRVITKSGPLVNITEGGEGTSGYRLTEGERRKRGLRHREWWSRVSQEEKQRIFKLVHSKFNHKAASRKAAVTKNHKSKVEKNEIERKRRNKWEVTYYNRTVEQRKHTSIKCSLASKKRGDTSRVFFILQNSNTGDYIKLSQYHWLLQYSIDSTVLANRFKTQSVKPIISKKNGEKFIYHSREILP